MALFVKDHSSTITLWTYQTLAK